MSEALIYQLSFAILSVSAVIFSILVVKHKSLVYSAMALGFLGMTNAALFIMLGHVFIGLFHMAVYVGAAVIFILFLITMFKEAPEVETPVKLATLIVIPLITLALAYVYLPYSKAVFLVNYYPYRELSKLFIEKYWFPLVITALALVTTLIEAITLARREVE